MGMMLETTATRLFDQPGGPHFGSPDKDPAVRLRVLEDAGRAAVPFTTGILVGIGETLAERADSLFAIRAARPPVRPRAGSDRPELPGQGRHRDARRAGPGDRGYLATVAVARLVLGPRARVQAPPNLSDPDELRRCWCAPASTTGAGSAR